MESFKALVTAVKRRDGAKNVTAQMWEVKIWKIGKPDKIKSQE